MKNTQREIKFRHYLGNNNWHYWGFIDDKFVGPAISSGVSLKEVKENSQQFTGLLDKSGIEIYEGDIVKWIADDGTEEYPHEREIIEEVKFECGAYQVLSSLPGIKFEIIGNIYEKQNKT